MDEQELKTLIDKAVEKTLGGDVKGIADTVNEIKGWGVDKGRVKQAENAIKQIEDTQKELLTTIDQKIAAASRRAYNGHGQYKGAFADEDEARCFALVVLTATGDQDQRKHWGEVMQAEYADLAASRKDITGDQAIIPHEHSARVHRLVEDSSVWAANAFRMPMATGELSFTRRISGFRARKTKHRTKVSKQDMAVAPVDLTASDFDILTSYPIQLEADALVVVAEMILMEMALGFSVALEEDGLIGDGTDAYDNEMGIIPLLKQINGVDDGGGLVLASGASGSGWGGVAKDDVLKLIGQARHTRPGMVKATCSNEFYWQVLSKIITDAGGVTRSEIAGAPGLQLFGVPIHISHVLPRSSGNSQVPLLVGDIGQSSTLGDRQQYSVRTSREVYFESKEVGVLATARYAINNHSLGDANTPGPVVGLVTREA